MTDAASNLSGRSVFVTGATGLIGSWIVRALLDADARVVALVRDEDPRSEFIRSGDNHRVVQVRGSLEQADLERALSTTKSTWSSISAPKHRSGTPSVTLLHRSNPTFGGRISSLTPSVA